MCFYAFSFRNSLSLEYVAETIFLYRNGLTTVEFDLLIQNTGQTKIDNVQIIFPRAFDAAAIKSIQILQKSRNEYNQKLVERTKYLFSEYLLTPEDQTWSILDTKRKENYRYCLTSNPPKVNEIHPNKYSFSISLPDYRNNAEIVELSGNISDVSVKEKKSENKWILNANLEPQERVLLTQQDFTVFTYLLKTKIDSDEFRWIRLRIPKYRGSFPSHGLKQLCLFCIGKLNYCYTLSSPFDILHRFLSKIDYTLSQAKNSSESLPNLKGYVSFLQEAKNITRTKRWRTHVFPRGFRFIHDLYVYDPNNNLIQMGNYPNYESDIVNEVVKRESNIFKKIWTIVTSYRYKTYDWNYQPAIDKDRLDFNVRDLDEKFGFRIFFKTKYISYRVSLAKVVIFLSAFILIIDLKIPFISALKNIVYFHLSNLTFYQKFYWIVGIAGSTIVGIIGVIKFINRLVPYLEKFFSGVP